MTIVIYLNTSYRTLLKYERNSMFCIEVNELSKIAELVGEKIRFLRQQRGLSQEKLALKADLNSSFLGLVERGQKSPTIDSLEKIATALDVTLEELFSFDYNRSVKADHTFMEKISFQLHGRTEMEQEAVYQFIKQLLAFRDKK
jgi:transcriptional regulator with XRE-family HTH domain